MKLRVKFKVKLGKVVGKGWQFERKTLVEEVVFDKAPQDDGGIRDEIEKRYPAYTFQDFEIIERETLTP